MKPKPSKHPQTAEEIRSITKSSLREMRAKKMSYRDIAKECGVHHRTIQERCYEYDIPKGGFNKKKL